MTRTEIIYIKWRVYDSLSFFDLIIMACAIFGQIPAQRPRRLHRSVNPAVEGESAKNSLM
jgi:hypothetical protein